MSESVWFEQIDIALTEHIQKIIKLNDPFGMPFSVPVRIRKPDEDFKLEEYPCISLYNLNSERDSIRYFPDMVVTSRDAEEHSLTLEKGAIPYNLYYQVDFWSKLQSHMNDMTRIWLSSYPDGYFNLPVKDLSGKSRSSFVLQQGGITKADLFKSDQRIFHSIFTYKIWVEIDERLTVEAPMVTQTTEVSTNKEIVWEVTKK